MSPCRIPIYPAHVSVPRAPFPVQYVHTHHTMAVARYPLSNTRDMSRAEFGLYLPPSPSSPRPLVPPSPRDRDGRTDDRLQQTESIHPADATAPPAPSRAQLRQHRPETSFEVLSNPEFLAEGSAVADLMRPDRILIGSSAGLSGLQAAVALRSVYAAWVPAGRVLTVRTFSSELTKLVANAMLAQRISSVNAVSALCEELGADVEEVSRALGADARLGPRFLHAGVGFGGSCFEKDILNLAYLARCLHLGEVADYWTAVLDINRYQRERFTKTAIRKLNGTLRGKKVAIFGFAFKDGTNDTRNSIAVHVIAELAAELPREIAVFDPGCAPDEVEGEIRRAVQDEGLMGRIKITSGWREAVDGASAVCILTQWDQFRGNRAVRQPERPALIPNNDLSSVLSRDKEPSEMDIIELERLVPSTAGIDGEDPLQRLLPRAACGPGCKDCERRSKLSGDQDVVDWAAVASMMEDHSWVFDGKNVVDGHYLKTLGFKVHSIGKGF